MSEHETAPEDVAERIADANRIFSGPVTFLKSAPRLEHLPDPTAPEIAFAGRSNVGKSSLVNALTGRRAIARASVTPGRTQELNFFDVGAPPLFRICDMPGYGYAKAPKAEVAKWRKTVEMYLRGRVVLKRAFLLIDSRHGVKDIDRELMDMLDKAAVSYRAILTKADKIKASELADVTAATEAEMRKHPAAYPEVLATSAEKRGGIDALRLAVLDAVAE